MIGKDRLQKLVFEVNTVTGAPCSRSTDGTAQAVAIECGLCFRSIGYRSTPMSEVPFDERRYLYPNTAGRIHHSDDAAVGQFYTLGWIKRGPSSVIGTNRADGVETIATLLGDLDELSRLGARRASAYSDLLASRK